MGWQACKTPLITGLLLACLLSPLATPAIAQAPALMLAQVYRGGIDLHSYWVSEKLDGVRARWDGQRLLSRAGLPVNAPAWFTAGWPAVPLDGELWIARGRFEDTVSTVRRQTPDDKAWRAVRFMVFDLPGHGGVFSERLDALRTLLRQVNQPWLQPIGQERGSTHTALMRQLDEVVRAGGEGLMLHRGNARYQALRSDDLLKVKPHEDADARVMGHEPGRGRLQGLVGALQVQTPDGRRFRLGSGLSDALRRDPPPVGSWVTYRFRGTHDSGLPRFATFVRLRPDAELQGLP
ncbi:MAG: DNA ligase [Hydrogenophaga sp.]